MIRLALAALALLVVTPQAKGPEFASYDVFIDPGDAAVAAWQVEVVPGEGAKVVGVGNGDGAFASKPAYYDPRALQLGGRIVLAAFTTDEVAAGRIRVATLEMYETGTGGAEYASKVVAAAAPNGKKIDVKVELVRKGRTK